MQQQVIKKNNGTINIKQIETVTKQFEGLKTLRQYKVTVIDLEGCIKLESVLKVIQTRDRIKYKFGHNSNNKKLVEYVVQELKKHKYIE